jgi:hypothetical protein
MMDGGYAIVFLINHVAWMVKVFTGIRYLAFSSQFPGFRFQELKVINLNHLMDFSIIFPKS